MMETEKRGFGLSGLTGGFLIFLLCILALIRDVRALDSGQVYRLLVLNAGLLLALLAFLFTPLRRKLNWDALGNRVVLAYAVYVALAREAMSRGHWNTMQKQAHLARASLRTLDTYAVPISFLEGFALMKKGSIDEAVPLFELADRESPDRFYILTTLP